MWLLWLAVALAVGESDEVCLLSLRSARTSLSAAAEWGNRHAVLRDALRDAVELRRREDAHSVKIPRDLLRGSTEVDIDKFIAQQEKSGDVCYAKVLEVKRTIDGLHMKVESIDAEMGANLQILRSQQRVVEDKEQELREAKQAYKDAMAECEKHRTASGAEAAKVQSWLDELINYAEPSVRSSVATNIRYDEQATDWAKGLAEKHANNGSEEALVQQSQTWDAAQCERAKAQLALARERLQEHQGANATGPVKYRELDCNASRAVLQEEYNKAYRELAKLKDQTASDGDEAYNLCAQEAKTRLDAASARLNEGILVATQNMERAEDVNSGLQPLLHDAQRALAKVQEHLTELQGSCKLEDSVSKHLQKVRDLIISLQKCPGRQDFRLRFPDGYEPKRTVEEIKR